MNKPILKMTYNRTTLNGTKWEIVADNYGAALYINNFDKPGYHFSGYYFKSVVEANAHLDAIDEKISNPRPISTRCEIPADYYGVAGRYYGD